MFAQPERDEWKRRKRKSNTAKRKRVDDVAADDKSAAFDGERYSFW